MKLIFLVFVLIAIYVYSSCKIVVPEDQRVVVVNLAKFDRVLSVGTHFKVPYTERDVWFDLNEYLPQWQRLSDDEINLKIKDIFLSTPDKF